ncbi:aldehyde dehydrogenase family protein [Streptomyces durhamensis]|uniref:aldehyde dehydrogenase family protein n=1 Tax=Streptomyces durhamensis TaxID=68194 RepID=UPI0004CD59CB|nr:aldehyde dehydrogenase family protein [Streptomyces durhamensis]
MTTGRHLVHASIAGEYAERLAHKAEHLRVGNPAKEVVPRGPVIDSGQRDMIHGLVTASVDGGARLAADGTYEDLFYRPTVLTDVTDASPAHGKRSSARSHRPAPSPTYHAVSLATATPCGLSLSIRWITARASQAPYPF